MLTIQRVSRHKETGFHHRLKEATRTAHRRLESQLPLLKSDFTVSEYQRLLGTFYGFYAPLESLMDACRAPALRADLDCRRKSWWLLDDLLSLGETHQAIGALPLCQDLPTMACQADVLGAMYVVESATLGGQVMLKNLSRSLGRDAELHVRFFTSYGSRVPEMWATFLRIVEAAAYNSVQERMIIDSACRTLTAFEQWLARCDGLSMRTTHGDMKVLHAS